jgi:hypothetical protein
MLPIVAGRILMGEMDLRPQLPDHYVIVGRDEQEREVRFAECGVCRIIRETVGADPKLAMVGMGSCEMQAMNDVLQQIGPDATPDRVAEIQILPPEMGGEPLTVT